MNYLFNRDVTIQFRKDRMVNDKEMCEILAGLVQKGYADAVPDNAYIMDFGKWQDLVFEDGVRIDKLDDIEAFKRAFLKRNIPYDPLWRKQDYVWAAGKWMYRVRENEKGKRRVRCGLPHNNRKAGAKHDR